METYRAIIVENEEPFIQSLSLSLERKCPMLELVATCKSVEEATAQIRLLKPHIVFLDIELNNRLGFDILHILKPLQFKVIFTTAHIKYATEVIRNRAIREESVDFLQKPIDENELLGAVICAIEAIDQVLPQQGKGIFDEVVSIPKLHGYRILNREELSYIEASNNRSVYHKYNGEKIEASQVLKKVEYILSQKGFKRIHNSFIINLQHLLEYSKQDGGYVLVEQSKGPKRLPIGAKYVDDLKNFLTNKLRNEE